MALTSAQGLAAGRARAQDDPWSLTRPRSESPGGASTPGSRAEPRASTPGSRAEARASTPALRVREAPQERYYRALLAQPEDDFALERLRSLAQAESGGLDALEARLRAACAQRPRDPRPAQALARVLISTERWDEAVRVLDAALGAADDPASTLLLRARLARERGLEAEARVDLAAVLERRPSGPQRRAALRALGELALARGELTEARARYEALAALAVGDPNATRGFAQALERAGRHAEAALEYQRLARALRGDRRWTASLLRDVARAQIAAGAFEQALNTLAEARRVDARAGAREQNDRAAGGLAAELDALELEAWRRAGKLDQAAEACERKGARGVPSAWRDAARMWQEQGDFARAAASYRAWLARTPADLDARAELAALLLKLGRADEAEREYRELVRRAPAEPGALMQLAELLRSTGQRGEALARLTEAAARAPRSAPLHRALRELYVRWDEPALAARELRVLSELDPHDPGHHVALGEEALRRGDRAGALAAFEKLLENARGDRAGAEAALARVLAEHDLLPEAIAHERKALELAPRLEQQRELASLLERAGQPDQAERAWQAILARSDLDPGAQREARQHLVGLWRRSGTAERHALELRERLRLEPWEAGTVRLLAELYTGDPARREAEIALLEGLLERQPRDLEALLALERAERRAGEARRALATLARVLELGGPESERHATRALEFALEHPQEDEARGLAERALALAPRSAHLQRLAAALFQRRGEDALALAAYERAAALDPRDFEARLALAEGALVRGERSRAEAHLQAVIAGAADDAQLAKAVQLAGAHAPAALEAWLLELASAPGAQPRYRRLLLDRYAPLVPLAREVAQGRAPADAQQRLAHTLELAQKPLLEALAAGDAGERALALALLAAAPRKEALGPLWAVAEHAGRPLAERAEALIAIGRLRDERAAERLRTLYARSNRHLRPLLAWALVASAGARAEPTLRTALAERDEDVRALAALLVGQLALATTLPQLRELVTSQRPAVRAAALWALARLEPGQHEPELLAASAAPAPLGIAALLALGPEHPRVMRGLFALDPRVRSLAAAQFVRPPRAPGPLPAPSWPFVADGYLGQLGEAAFSAGPLQMPSDARWAALTEGALAALRDGVDARAGAGERTVEARAGAGEGRGDARAGVGERDFNASGPSADTVERALAELSPYAGGLAPRALLAVGLCVPAERARAFAIALHDALALLARGPDPGARARALELLVQSGAAERPEVIAVLRASDSPERRSVLAALASLPALPQALRPELLALYASPAWPVRVDAAGALREQLADAVLAREPIALVRTAARTPRPPALEARCERASGATN